MVYSNRLTISFLIFQNFRNHCSKQALLQSRVWLLVKYSVEGSAMWPILVHLLMWVLVVMDFCTIAKCLFRIKEFHLNFMTKLKLVCKALNLIPKELVCVWFHRIEYWPFFIDIFIYFAKKIFDSATYSTVHVVFLKQIRQSFKLTMNERATRKRWSFVC